MNKFTLAFFVYMNLYLIGILFLLATGSPDFVLSRLIFGSIIGFIGGMLWALSLRKP